MNMETKPAIAAFAERILAKVIGHEISAEELDLVSGGRPCDIYATGTYNDNVCTCDSDV